MKHILLLLTAALSLSLTACAQTKQNPDTMKKAIVVYFSATRTTRSAAQRLAASAHADLMPIEPAQPYTQADLDWTNSQSRSTKEMKNLQSRPEIKTPKYRMDAYQVVFLGYPIWWDLAPTVVNTFIESQHLDGKTVVPFATSGGSSISHSVAQLKRLYPKIHWQQGRLLNGATNDDLARWVKSLGME
jgi:flavodoxin